MGWGTPPVVPWWEKFSSNVPVCSSIRFKIKLEAFISNLNNRDVLWFQTTCIVYIA